MKKKTHQIYMFIYYKKYALDANKCIIWCSEIMTPDRPTTLSSSLYLSVYFCAEAYLKRVKSIYTTYIYVH